MKKKKNIFIIILGIIVLSIGFLFVTELNNKNLIKLNYNDVIKKINNKDTFVLCISASECIHCKDYKPKLKKIAEKYDITIYYVNVDEFDEENYNEFKKKLSFDGGTPTTIFFKNGEEKTTATRIEGNEKIEKVINKLKNNGFIKE